MLPDVPAVEEHFGVWKSRHDSKSCPLARLSLLFDILNDVTIDAFVGPKSVGEREAARRHFKHSDLLLLDRGYAIMMFSKSFIFIVGLLKGSTSSLKAALKLKTLP